MSVDLAAGAPAAMSSRDRHLFGPGPKRILALDGGGVRGVISVAFAQQIEKLLAQKANEKVRLCDAFDLIGGTSTGSIIATALALGKTTEDLKTVYHELAPLVFEWSPYIKIVQPKFDAGKLADEIEKIVGSRTLGSPEIETGLAIIAKRADTDSVWIVSNSPRAPYWSRRPGGTTIANQDYKLAHLIRASTAAPTYFAPGTMQVLEGAPAGLFIDGGMSPHNNPALAMFIVSQFKPYGLCWPTGSDNLTVVSIGTGSYRRVLDPATLGLTQYTITKHALLTMMDDAQGFSLAMMQWIGKNLTPWRINREWGSLAGEQLGSVSQFRFLRYDVRLERDWLKQHAGIDVTEEQLEVLREMDRTEYIGLAYEIGCAAAEKQVLESHWIDGSDAVSEPL